jgi:two-component system, OmpR family, response regulator ResD
MATILCIDDDPRILEIQRVLLRDQGSTVLTAADGLTGIALASKHHIDVAVVDLNLPGMHGNQVAQLLMKGDPALPVVLWSGDLDDIPQCLKRFADALVGKADGRDTFLSTVEELVPLKAPAESCQDKRTD